MKNKIFLMLILIFTFVLGSSCFASISYNDFISALDELDELNNTTRQIDPPHEEIDSILETYDNFLIFRRSDGVYWFTFGYEFYGKTYGSNYLVRSTNMSNTVLRAGTCLDSPFSWSWSPFNDEWDTIYTNNNNFTDTYIRSGNVFSDENLTTILYPANFELTPPTPSTPTISISNTVYTELSSNVWCTVNRNGYEDRGFIVLKKYDLNDELIDYMSINYFFEDNYYDDEHDSWTLPLNSFYEFNFSNDYYYIAELHYDNEVVESDSFQVMFSDNYTVPDGGVYDLTPTITYYPESVSTSKTVSITSPIENSTIYYKLSSNGVWVMYSEPFTVNQNCTIYSHCYDVSGQSASSHVVISNIGSVEDFNNRVTLSPKCKYDVTFESDGKKYVDIIVDVIDGQVIEWSSDLNAWSDFPSNLFAFGNRRYKFSVDYLPRTYYFRYRDEISGFYSPTATLFIQNKETILAGVHGGGTSQPAYDDNGNYIPNNNSSSDFNGGWNSYFGTNIYNQDGTVNTGAIVSNSLKSSWSFIAELPAFFAIFQGLFVFIPDSIMVVIFAFLTIKFIIAIIGFLRG